MPTPQPRGAAPGTRTAARGAPVSGTASEVIPLPETSFFRYWVCPYDVTFQAGEPVYNPVRVEIIPGVQRVPGDGSPDTIDGYQRRLGRIEVPEDFEVLAWGETRVGYVDRMTLGYDPNGKEIARYDDAWTRWDQLGHTMHRRFDIEGWADFCRRVSALLPGPDEDVADIERARIEGRLIETRHASPHSAPSARVAEQLAEQLTPAEGTPTRRKRTAKAAPKATT